METRHIKRVGTLFSNVWLLELPSLGKRVLIDTGHSLERIGLMGSLWHAGCACAAICMGFYSPIVIVITPEMPLGSENTLALQFSARKKTLLICRALKLLHSSPRVPGLFTKSGFAALKTSILRRLKSTRYFPRVYGNGISGFNPCRAIRKAQS
ncbi:unnamed protein product [Sphagnum jensenii]|uniref:Uncharacterized protein n=1 Tax=Sphagnum jensenii TaxID=128206 RepID=A0ABP0VJ61_9BRYO